MVDKITNEDYLKLGRMILKVKNIEATELELKAVLDSNMRMFVTLYLENNVKTTDVKEIFKMKNVFFVFFAQIRNEFINRENVKKIVEMSTANQEEIDLNETAKYFQVEINQRIQREKEEREKEEKEITENQVSNQEIINNPTEESLETKFENDEAEEKQLERQAEPQIEVREIENQLQDTRTIPESKADEGVIQPQTTQKSPIRAFNTINVLKSLIGKSKGLNINFSSKDPHREQRLKKLHILLGEELKKLISELGFDKKTTTAKIVKKIIESQNRRDVQDFITLLRRKQKEIEALTVNELTLTPQGLGDIAGEIDTSNPLFVRRTLDIEDEDKKEEEPQIIFTDTTALSWDGLIIGDELKEQELRNRLQILVDNNKELNDKIKLLREQIKDNEDKLLLEALQQHTDLFENNESHMRLIEDELKDIEELNKELEELIIDLNNFNNSEEQKELRQQLLINIQQRNNQQPSGQVVRERKLDDIEIVIEEKEKMSDKLRFNREIQKKLKKTIPKLSRKSKGLLYNVLMGIPFVGKSLAGLANDKFINLISSLTGIDNINIQNFFDTGEINFTFLTITERDLLTIVDLLLSSSGVPIKTKIGLNVIRLLYLAFRGVPTRDFSKEEEKFLEENPEILNSESIQEIFDIESQEQPETALPFEFKAEEKAGFTSEPIIRRVQEREVLEDELKRLEEQPETQQTRERVLEIKEEIDNIDEQKREEEQKFSTVQQIQNVLGRGVRITREQGLRILASIPAIMATVGTSSKVSTQQVSSVVGTLALLTALYQNMFGEENPEQPEEPDLELGGEQPEQKRKPTDETITTAQNSDIQKQITDTIKSIINEINKEEAPKKTSKSELKGVGDLRPEFISVGTSYFDRSTDSVFADDLEWINFGYISEDKENPILNNNNLHQDLLDMEPLFMPMVEKEPSDIPLKLFTESIIPMNEIIKIEQEFKEDKAHRPYMNKSFSEVIPQSLFDKGLFNSNLYGTDRIVTGSFM